MSQIPRLPGPDNVDEGPDESQSQSRHHEGPDRPGRRWQRRSTGHIQTPAQILEMMSKLPQLVVAGIITPAQCNAILAVLRAMLAQLQSGSAASPSGQAVPPGLRDAIQRSPDLLNFLAGWLTDEQLEELMDDEELGNGS